MTDYISINFMNDRKEEIVRIEYDDGIVSGAEIRDALEALLKMELKEAVGGDALDLAIDHLNDRYHCNDMLADIVFVQHCINM